MKFPKEITLTESQTVIAIALVILGGFKGLFLAIAYVLMIQYEKRKRK